MAAVQSTMLPLGTPAPTFALPDPSGRLWSLDDFAGTPVLVVAFLCNHCPYVKHVRHRLAEVAAELQAQGAAFIAINSNDVEAYPEDAPEAMARESAEIGYPFPYVFDEAQEVAKAYRAACTPDFYVFDADRCLVYRGQFDDSRPGSAVPVTGDDLQGAVTAALDGRVPDVDQRPSLGCSIKWRPGDEPAWG